MCDSNSQRYNKNGLTIESDHYLCFQSPMWKNVIKNLDLKVMVSTMHYKTMLERELLFLKRPKEFGKWITENQQRSQTWYSLLFAFRIVLACSLGLLCFNSHVIWSLLFFDGDFVMVLKDRANEIYKRVEDQKSSRGRNQDALLAACLYIACRQEDKPRTVKGTAYEFFNIWMLPDFSFPKWMSFPEHVDFN